MVPRKWQCLKLTLERPAWHKECVSERIRFSFRFDIAGPYSAVHDHMPKFMGNIEIPDRTALHLFVRKDNGHPGTIPRECVYFV
jgi:hypothetical protein